MSRCLRSTFRSHVLFVLALGANIHPGVNLMELCLQKSIMPVAGLAYLCYQLVLKMVNLATCMGIKTGIKGQGHGSKVNCPHVLNSSSRHLLLSVRVPFNPLLDNLKRVGNRNMYKIILDFLNGPLCPYMVIYYYLYFSWTQKISPKHFWIHIPWSPMTIYRWPYMGMGDRGLWIKKFVGDIFVFREKYK